MDEQRFVEIETKLAHQELLLAELNQVMIGQQEAISQMQAALKTFFKRQEAGGDEVPIGPGDDKPPHY